MQPAWVQAALTKAAESPEHAQDMEALGADPDNFNAWPIGPAVEVWRVEDSYRGAILARIKQREIRAVEEAGRLYQAALDAWRASCATTSGG